MYISNVKREPHALIVRNSGSKSYRDTSKNPRNLNPKIMMNGYFKMKDSSQIHSGSEEGDDFDDIDETQRQLEDIEGTQSSKSIIKAIRTIDIGAITNSK